MEIKPCPFCGGEVTVGDCGYSSFNPGFADCRGECARHWDLGYVDSAWIAGKRWNSMHGNLLEIDLMLRRMKDLGLTPDDLKRFPHPRAK